jgi:cytosine/adenosine deaminase-related metal-dependent hydrolase
MALYLKNASFIDWQTFQITDTNIKVHKGENGRIELTDEPAGITDDIFDCKGKIVTKSFGCGHHHIYSALARGMPAPKKIPADFTEILTYVWWNLDKCLDKEMIEASALAAAMQCAKNGVTFVIDHHSSPFAAEGSLDIIAKAFDKVGISHLLCLELSDRDGKDALEAGIDAHTDYLAKGGQGHIGLHASFTVGNVLLRRAVDLAQKYGTGIHIHTAEDRADQTKTVELCGKRVVNRLKESGALELPRTILIHCVHLDDDEKRIIRESGRYIAENIESNQNNNVGIADYSSITEKVMLGTDGMHSDMIRSAKAAFLAGQASEGLSMQGCYDRFRNVHRYISESGFTGDADNNLVILDYDTPTEVTADNFLGHFIYGLESSHVHSVVCKGEMIVKDHRLTKIKEDEILTYSREMASKLWEKMKS